MTGRSARPTAERFWEKVQRTEACWLWIGSRDDKGYGELFIHTVPRKNQRAKAHRVSWELHFGQIPDGMFVCHHCDNPCCVRPDHLFLGTNADNMRDCYAKGRAKGVFLSGRSEPKGQCATSAKLTDAIVADIRRLKALGHSGQAIATHYGVCRSTVSMIWTGKTWTHVAPEV